MKLDHLDLAIIAIYLAGITLFGLRFRKKQRTLRDYFLADRTIPWWAIALSIVAAETSTLTIISIPGLAYDTDMAFLQVVFGYLVARVIICIIFIPSYFRGEMYTAYQLIERRFGPHLRSLAAGLFLITRAAAEGVRVFAVSIVVGIAIGTGEIASIAIITLLTLIYTFEGGMAAVIWTDVIQMIIYIGGTAVGFVTLLHLVPGGWSTIHSAAAAAGKLRIFDFTPTFSRTYTFWAGLIGGTFLTTASHGTDQLMCSACSRRKTKRSRRVRCWPAASSSWCSLRSFCWSAWRCSSSITTFRRPPPSPAPTASFPRSLCATCRAASPGCSSPPFSPRPCPT